MAVIKHWQHYNQVEPPQWPSQFFKPQELACRGTGELKINLKALSALEQARQDWGMPFVINSAYRSAIHNARIGGAVRSRHKYGDAFDLNLLNYNIDILYKHMKKYEFNGFGFYKNFLHIDMGRTRIWGK